LIRGNITNKSFDYKSLTSEDLELIFKGVKFKVKPRWHQFVSLAFALDIRENRVSYLHGVGTGKTLCALFTAQLWECKRILVVCPTSAFGAWERDIPFGTYYSYVMLTGSGKDRKAKLREDKNVFVVNWEGLKTIFCKFEKGKGWKLDPFSLGEKFDCIIFDEIHRCKNHRTLQTRICYELSKRCPRVIGMTGSPVDRSLLELFNIYKVIDLGASLGVNFIRYRSAYFYKGGFEWCPKKGAEKKILSRISRITISFDRSECLDLPEIQEEILPIVPTEEFLRLQDLTIDDMPLVDSEVYSGEISVRANRLRQLPNGFFYYKTPENDKNVYYLESNPKIEALIDLINDTESKIIVFYQFVEERNLIEAALEKNNIFYRSVYGGQNQLDRISAIKEFSDMPSTLVLVAQIKCAAEGWDGTASNTIVYFSPIASPTWRTQCNGRIHRDGQSKKCLVIDFVMKGSIEERIVRNRGERFNLVEEVMSFIEEYGGRR